MKAIPNKIQFLSEVISSKNRWDNVIYDGLQPEQPEKKIHYSFKCQECKTDVTISYVDFVDNFLYTLINKGVLTEELLAEKNILVKHTELSGDVYYGTALGHRPLYAIKKCSTCNTNYLGVFSFKEQQPQRYLRLLHYHICACWGGYLKTGIVSNKRCL